MNVKERIVLMKERQAQEQAARDAAGEVMILSSSGALFFQVLATDCMNVAQQVHEGTVLRPNGFRDTIHRLMQAGF